MLETEDVREMAWRAFGEWALHKVDPKWAAERIAHEPARRLLTDLGLPVQGPAYFSLSLREDGTYAAVRDYFAAHSPEVLQTRLCTEFGHYLILGELNGEDIVLDPESGRLYWLRGPHESVERILVNSGVAEFLAFLSQIEIHRVVDGHPFEIYREGSEEEYAEALRAVLKGIIFGVKELDRPVFPPRDNPEGFESFWYPWLIEHADEDLAFDSWNWGRVADDYFAARGIRDLEQLTPRHPVDRTQD
jgi:hypothetical protein